MLIPTNSKLYQIASLVAEPLQGLQWCIAGGAVRDTLLGLEPKDYDLFVLGASEAEVERRCKALTPANTDIFHVPVAPSSQSDLVDDYIVAGETVQVIASDHTTVQGLLFDFDWNICKFAYMDGQIIGDGQLPVAGATLILNSSRFPTSTLARGRRFADRFSMTIPDATVASLIQKKHSRPNV